MATICNQFQIGRNTKVSFASITPACTEPASANLLTGALKAVSPTPTTISLSAAIAVANFFVPSGDYLEIVDPTSGVEVLVRLAANLKTGDSSISVVSVDKALAAASTITYPPVLKRRASVTISDNGTMVNSYAFEDGGYEVPATVTREVPIDLSGDYSPGSAAFRNFRNRGKDGGLGYLWVEDPASATYTKGEIYKGVFCIGNVPKAITSTDITKSALTGKFVGGYTIVDPVLA
jgi:hypothetical protein